MVRELKEFTVSIQSIWSGSSPFGGGHTVETDPTKRGWRLVAVSDELAVIGRKGKPGCFGIRTMSGGDRGKYLIGLYEEEKPEELTELLKEGKTPPPNFYATVDAVSGWILDPIDDLERLEAEVRASLN